MPIRRALSGAALVVLVAACGADDREVAHTGLAVTTTAAAGPVEVPEVPGEAGEPDDTTTTTEAPETTTTTEAAPAEALDPVTLLGQPVTVAYTGTVDGETVASVAPFTVTVADGAEASFGLPFSVDVADGVVLLTASGDEAFGEPAGRTDTVVLTFDEPVLAGVTSSVGLAAFDADVTATDTELTIAVTDGSALEAGQVLEVQLRS